MNSENNERKAFTTILWGFDYKIFPLLWKYFGNMHSSEVMGRSSSDHLFIFHHTNKNLFHIKVKLFRHLCTHLHYIVVKWAHKWILSLTFQIEKFFASFLKNEREREQILFCAFREKEGKFNLLNPFRVWCEIKRSFWQKTTLWWRQEHSGFTHSLSFEDNKDDKIDQKLNFPSEWQRNKGTFSPSFMQQQKSNGKDKRIREKISFGEFSFGK